MKSQANQVEKSLFHCWEIYGRYPLFKVEHDVDHVRTLCGLPNAFLNNVFLPSGELIQTTKRVKEIAEHFTAHNMNCKWVVGPRMTNKPRFLALLNECGFKHLHTSPGMLLGKFNPAPPPPGFTFERVTTEQALAEWVSVLVEVFEFSPDVGGFLREVNLQGQFYRLPEFELYLARHNGKAVACGNSFYETDMTGIFNVATLAPYRGKGVGAHLTSLCVQSSAKQNRPTFLFSSPLGLSVYQKLGFETMCELEQYA